MQMRFLSKIENALRRITDLKQLFYPPGDHYSLIRLLHYLCPITLLPYCQWHSYSIASASCSSLSECFVFRILHLLSVTQFKFVHLYAHTRLMQLCIRTFFLIVYCCSYPTAPKCSLVEYTQHYNM